MINNLWIFFYMLRELLQEDIQALAFIETLIQISPWTEKVFEQCLGLGSRGWVVEVNQKVIGFVLFFDKVGEGHILNIGVHPEFQRHGYGRLLLEKVLAAAQESQVSMVYLEVRVSNLKAISLYKSMGFSQLGVRKNYYSAEEGREDAMILVKNI